MRRIAFYSVFLFAVLATCAVAEEKKNNGPDKKEPAAQATQNEKSVDKKTTTDADTKSASQKDSDKSAEPQKGKDGLYQIEKNIVEYTNRERVRRGLKPLAIDKTLVESARGQAKWMTRTRRLQHTRKPVAENIAMGYRTSESVVRGWMNSKGHRANILNSSYRRIGVAAYRAPDGTVWWCQQFLR
ncbi:MAG: CAP domain-containing protein [Planctomycetia bacterium]|jgi:uncharacterized protein YkwD